MFVICILSAFYIKNLVFYGDGGYPLIFLFLTYFVCLLFAAQQIHVIFHKADLRKNMIKKLFLIFLVIFLMYRSILLFVPFPYRDEVSCTIFSQQLPCYILFVDWLFLALWIGNAVTTMNFNKCHRIITAIIFISSLIIFFAVMIIIPLIFDV